MKNKSTPLTSVVCGTVFAVPQQTAGMLRGRRLPVLVLWAPGVSAPLPGLQLALGRDLAQRNHLQAVLLARSHAVH